MAKITVDAWLCNRCGHEWVSNKQDNEEPIVCPKCKSPYWNKTRLEQYGEDPA